MEHGKKTWYLWHENFTNVVEPIILLKEEIIEFILTEMNNYCKPVNISLSMEMRASDNEKEQFMLALCSNMELLKVAECAERKLISIVISLFQEYEKKKFLPNPGLTLGTIESVTLELSKPI